MLSKKVTGIQKVFSSVGFLHLFLRRENFKSSLVPRKGNVTGETCLYTRLCTPDESTWP